MARTLRWTGAHDDNSTNALNWNDLTNGLDPAAAPPGAGDTEIIGFGTVVTPPDATLSGNLIEIGGTAGATLVFNGDSLISLANATVDAASTIDSLVPNDTSTSQTVLDALGTFVNQGRIVADGPADSQFTIVVGQNGALPGFFINQGVIESEVGNTLSIVVGPTSEVFNPGLIIDNGGTLVITTSGAGQIVGGYAPVLGLVEIEAGGTTEFNAALPASADGTFPFFYFADGADDLLKIDQIGQFSGPILGFAAGDTINLGALPAITSITYSATDILALSDSAGVVASLVIGGDHPIGTFDVVGGVAGNFTLTAMGGDTLLTTSMTNAVWTGLGGNGLWTTGSNWASGAPPSATDIALIGDGNAQAFTVSTGPGAVSVAGVILNDPDATLEVANNLLVEAAQENTFGDIAGTVQVDAGATLGVHAFRQYQADTDLDLLAGASLDVLGRADLGFTNDGTIPVKPGENFGVVLEGTATIDGATLNAGPTQAVAGATGGDILIGLDGAGTPAIVTVENAGAIGASVSDTYSVLYSAPTSFGALTISGAQTNWTDAGDPTDTQNTRGFMFIGYNPEAVNTPSPPYAGAAQLTVESGATLTEAAYANIASDVGSAGSVLVTSGAHWNIGNVTGSGTPLGFLQVGFHGIGSLLVSNGGQVAVGAGGTIVSSGTQEAVNYSVEIGHDAGASGVLTVDGSGSELTTLNSVRNGDFGSGAFSVQDNASAFIGGNVNLGGTSAGPDGGIGLLSITAAGRIEQAAGVALTVWQGSTAFVDGTSALDVGGSGTFVLGSVHIDGGSNLHGDGVIDASVDNDSAVHATDNGIFSLSTGGLLDIKGAVTGTGAMFLEPGATLKVAGAVASTQTITFNAGLPETLILGTPGGALASDVANLQDFDRIELGGISITGASVTSPGVVTVTTSGANYVLEHVGFAPGADQAFLTGRDPISGDDFIQVTCFAEGTRILTPCGEIAVEGLRAGDLVLIMENGAPAPRPVRWIGTRHIDLTAHPQPELARPIRITRHAVAENVPHRDLLVSPDHAILLDGVLIPTRLLVNGASIVGEEGLASIRYLHVELGRHSVLLAEGLETESYLDTGNRALFENTGAAMIAHPDLATPRTLRWDADSCAPLVTDPARVEPIWRRLAERAVALGHRLPDVAPAVDPGLWLEGDAVEVSARNGRHVFALARGTRAVRLRSRVFRPADRRPWLDDRRRLGVPVARIVLHGPAGTEEIAMDDPALSNGWWDAERASCGVSRWTDGDARLAVPEATQMVEIRLAGAP